jgi:alkylation response protein AidB-like acyl-CoA dehydrogenase
VFDVSKFARLHPGGKEILLEQAGTDATEIFYRYHRYDVILKYQDKLVIGQLEGAKTPNRITFTDISTVPFGEPSAEQGFLSPYYSESHKNFRREIRKFLAAEVVPHALTCETNGTPPSPEMFQKLGAAGFWACRLAPGPHLKFFPSLFGVKPEEFNPFHELICHDEIMRLGCPGFVDGLGSGLVIGLPPVIVFGSKEMHKTVVPKCLLGEKTICLAISEPAAGSDVANIVTTAKKSPCGKFYIVNGFKKWITNATFCDYFVTAVRTGEKGLKGISVLLIERGPGVETELIKTSYSPAAGTGYITFENVMVPVENLLGKENAGFQIIMSNFNHERWVICVAGLRGCRAVTEECLRWVNQRMVFDKKLIEQPVIRLKLAQMISAIESCQNWLENITYQMTHLNYKDQSTYLAGPIALLKYQITRTMNLCMDQSVQIFGGRAISREGMGQVIERFYRSHKFSAILGGSEEIMADLGIKQTMRLFPHNARL